jgi:hypothetical protein
MRQARLGELDQVLPLLALVPARLPDGFLVLRDPGEKSTATIDGQWSMIL